MGPQSRMSPVSAFFLGLFGVGAVTIAGATSIVLYGMRVVDKRSDAIFGIVENTVSDLPALLEQLPKSLGELLQDRRAFDYASKIDVVGKFIFDERRDRVRPSLVITNKGSEVVSLMTVRVAALNAQKDAVAEWTETVATPIGIADEWRGTLAPGATRYVVLPCDGGLQKQDIAGLTPVIEVSELRIWTPGGVDQDRG